MFLEVIGACGMVFSAIAACGLLLAFLSECSYSLNFHLEHKARQATPMSLPDYRQAETTGSHLAWYPLPPLVTLPLDHCSACGHPYEEIGVLFCGECGTPSESLVNANRTEEFSLQ